MAQGVPEKPELETRTFRPSSGAALTATGFVDDTTKQRQFSAGLSAFSNLLKKGGEFEQKRRVFNDKIIAQTAITLGEKDPTFLTTEGQFVYNNMLADKAANDFILKLNKTADTQSRLLFGSGLGFTERAEGYKNITDTLIKASTTGLQFSVAQQNVYGQKVLAHQLNMLNEFQKVNMEFVAQDTYDVKASSLTSSMRIRAGLGDRPEFADLNDQTGLGDGRRDLPRDSIERIINRAYARGVDKEFLLDWDVNLGKMGISKDDRIKMMIESLTIVGRETDNPFIFSVLNQDFGGGFNPATGRFAKDIEAARAGLGAEFRERWRFNNQRNTQEKKLEQEGFLSQAIVQLNQLGASNQIPLTEDGMTQFVTSKFPGMDAKSRTSIRSWWRSRVESTLQADPTGYTTLNRMLDSGKIDNLQDYYDESAKYNLRRGDRIGSDQKAYKMFLDLQAPAEKAAIARADNIVKLMYTKALNSGTAFQLGNSSMSLHNEQMVDIAQMQKDSVAATGKKIDPAILFRIMEGRTLSATNNAKLDLYKRYLDSQIDDFFERIDISASAKEALAETFLTNQLAAFVKDTDAAKLLTPATEKELAILKEKGISLIAEGVVKKEPSGEPGKEKPPEVKKPDQPKIAVSSSEATNPIENALVNPEEPAQKVENQITATGYELNPTMQLLISNREENIELLHKIGAIEARDAKIAAEEEKPILSIPFVEKLKDKFQDIGTKIKAGFTEAGVDIREGLTEAGADIRKGIKRLMNGERSDSETNPSVIKFKKESNLNDISDSEAGRILKHIITKKNVVVDANKQQISKVKEVKKGTNILAKLKESGVSSAKPLKENIEAIKTIPGATEFLSSIKANVSAFVKAVEDRAILSENTLEENIRVIQKYKQGDSDEVSPDTTGTTGGTVPVPPGSVGEPEDKGEEISGNIKSLATLALRSANSVIDLISGEAEAATSDITLTNKPLLSAALFGSNFYNASPTDSERIAWAKNADAGIRKYRANKLNKKEQINVTKMLTTLSKAKSSFAKDLKVIGITFEHFKELMIGVYAAETSFGTSKSKISRTGVVGELQVTRGTFRDTSKPRGNFGPLMAKEVGITIQKIRKFSDLELKALLLNNNKFNYLAGAAIMLSKLQNAKKKIKRGR